MIITIGREYGSGGRHVGEKLAERLNFKFYDKNLLAMKAKESDNYDELKAFYEEEPISSLLHVIATSSTARGHKVPFNFIREIAQQEDCVIIGRCGNFILRENIDMISVFIKSKEEKRAQMVAGYEDINVDKAFRRMEKVDKEREAFHRYYTDEYWLDLTGYDLVIDSGTLGIDATVDLIAEYIEKREKNEK